jgi:tRNA threonylcarbamoyladenosine modification (KEOPS) complex Cgi121 subunit
VLRCDRASTKAVYKAYLLEHVIPAIKAQWPRGEKASQSGYSKIMLRHISSRMIETSLKLDGVVAGIFGCSTSHQTHLTSMFLT